MRKVTRRSRGGCDRCKSLHTKCDEARPACGRCAKAKVKCSGYQRPIKWSRKHEVHSPNENPPSPSDSQDSTTREKRNKITSINNEIEDTPDNRRTSLNCTSDAMFGMVDWFDDLIAPDLDTNFSNITVGPFLSLTSDPFSSNLDMDAWDDTCRSPEISSLQTVFSSPKLALPTKRKASTATHNSEDRYYDCPSLMTTLYDRETCLAQFYFRETARIYSMYDGSMNPFRAWVSRVWSQSRLVYCAMQSMAAANLEGVYPELVTTGKELRGEAINLLAGTTDCENETLLALLMLGATSSWFNPKDSGIALFKSFQSRLKRGTMTGKLEENSEENIFFQGSLVYWKMLLSYVQDEGNMFHDRRPLHSLPHSDLNHHQRAPHPWTGVGYDISAILCDVGSLVRKERHRVRSTAQYQEDQIEMLKSSNSILEALELESQLLQIFCPTEHQVVNPGDRSTPIQHLLQFSEIYRLLGLLQIYRIFPDVLKQRLQTQESIKDPKLKSVFDLVMSPAEISTGDLSNSTLSQWLTLFTLRIIERLKHLPVEAGTGAFQPFLLVACSSELRLPPAPAANIVPQVLNPMANPEIENEEYQLFGASIAERVEVVRARRMIVGRLEMLHNLLPPKPWELCIRIVKEMWNRLDSADYTFGGGTLDTKGLQAMPFWIDIMIDNGWETLMG